jgi:hypothetical protein
LQRYQSEAKIEQVDGFAMVKEMAEEMENMMGDKIEAIKVKTSDKTIRAFLPSEILDKAVCQYLIGVIFLTPREKSFY